MRAQWGEGRVYQVHGEGEDMSYTLATKVFVPIEFDELSSPLLLRRDFSPISSPDSSPNSSPVFQRFQRRAKTVSADLPPPPPSVWVLHPSLANVPAYITSKWEDAEGGMHFEKMSSLCAKWDGSEPRCPLTAAAQRDITYSLEQARADFGPSLQFTGVTQAGLGPEMCGMSREQLLEVQDLPGCNPARFELPIS